MRPASVRTYENQNAHHIEQVEQNRRHGPYFAQHVADFSDEKALGEDAEEQKVQRHQHDQRRQIEHHITVHNDPPALLAPHPIQYVSERMKLQRAMGGPQLGPHGRLSSCLPG
jgi:hypothetical protein